MANEKVLQEFEAVALEGVREMRAFFTYQGTDPKYFQRARMAAAVMGAYTRLRATMANEEALRIAQERSLPQFRAPGQIG